MSSIIILIIVGYYLISIFLDTKCHVVESSQQFGVTGTSQMRKLGLGNRESQCRCRAVELSLFSVHHTTQWASYVVMNVCDLAVGCGVSDFKARVRLLFVFPLAIHLTASKTHKIMYVKGRCKTWKHSMKYLFFIYVDSHLVPERDWK